MALYCGNCGERLGEDSQQPLQPGYSNQQYAPPYTVAPKSKGLATGCIVALVLAAIIPLVGILAAIALPNYIKTKDKAKEAEVKANLHNIQLAVEKFALDHDGLYPNYLIGGEGKYATRVTDNGDFLAVTDCKQETISDVLMRLGYLNAYPTNPFTRNGHSIHQMQDFNSIDPLRNETNSVGNKFGTRFGAECTTMGSVLAELRYKQWSMEGSSGANTYPTYSDVVYPFWDLWNSNRPEPFLPGQFFYKGNGVMIPEFKEGTEELDGNMYPPKDIDDYMLGAYGSIRTKGKDVLGDEPKIHFNYALESKSIEFAPWTRSDNRGVGGSPYSDSGGFGYEHMYYGNPNGIRDSLILILTAGEDYITDQSQ